MPKISYVMLVSRYNKQLLNALKSIHKQKPDEFKTYIDLHALGQNTSRVIDLVRKYGGKPVLQTRRQGFTHHMNVVDNHHMAFLNARYPVISQCDDDDELLSCRRDVVDKHFDSDVGIIYGDVLMFKPKHPPRLRITKQIHHQTEVNHIIGSGRILNREAFKEIHHMLDHGYWLDFKIYYWIMRAGYRVVYVPKLFSVQNVNLDVNEERKEARRRGWQSELKSLESTEFQGEERASHRTRW